MGKKRADKLNKLLLHSENAGSPISNIEVAQLSTSKLGSLSVMLKVPARNGRFVGRIPLGHPRPRFCPLPPHLLQHVGQPLDDGHELGYPDYLEFPTPVDKGRYDL